MTIPDIQCCQVDSFALDGDLNKPDWRLARAHSLVRVSDGGAPRNRSTVRFLWSEEFLYVGFAIHDDAAVTSFKHRGDPVYLEDAVEVFVDPYGFGKTYYEVDVSPSNVVFDALIVNRQLAPSDDRDISTLDSFSFSALATATLAGPGGWSAEIAVPLRELAPPRPPEVGDRWSLNAFRVDFDQAKGTEYQALSPTGRVDFHRPESFVGLRFA